MKLFLKYIGEFLRKYPQVKLTKNDETIIRDSSMSHLGLTNLNQLRDRYEGQSFFEKTMKNIGGLMALQKHLNTKLMNINNADLTDFQPYIILNDERIDIHVFDFGTLPLLKISEIKNPIFFIIQKDSLTFTLCGTASLDVLKNNLIETSIEKSSTDYIMNFVGFKFLKDLN